MKQKETTTKDYRSVAETARELGISVQSVYVLCRKKDFPAVRITPRRIVIPSADLAEWMRHNAGAGKKVSDK